MLRDFSCCRILKMLNTLLLFANMEFFCLSVHCNSIISFQSEYFNFAELLFFNHLELFTLFLLIVFRWDAHSFGGTSKHDSLLVLQDKCLLGVSVEPCWFVMINISNCAHHLLKCHYSIALVSCRCSIHTWCL